MLKFSRRNKRLVIPVGINPNYGIDYSKLHDISNATAEPNDIIKGMTAYSKDGYIVGTLDIESRLQDSYQEGYEFGYDEGNTAGYRLGYEEGNEIGYEEGNTAGYETGKQAQKDLLESITITENGTYTREDGYNSVVVDVPDLNGDYDEGYTAGYESGYNQGESDGIDVGRNEVIEGMNDATITSGTVFKGEVGYGKDGARIVGDYEFVEGFDFSVIGYNQAESNSCNQAVNDDIAYSKTLYDAWDPSRTSAQNLYNKDTKLVYAPNINLENVVNGCQSMFNSCTSLRYVPALNTRNCLYFGNMFNGCTSLTSVPKFNTSNAKAFDYMFAYCSKLTSVPLFDTSNVTNMSNMFAYCSNLTTVPLFDTSKVANMSYMFSNPSANGNLTDAPAFNTSNVTNIRNMYMGQIRLRSIPQYDLSNVVTLGPFLYRCSALTSVPNFNTSKATNYSETFSGCTSLATIGLLDMSSATEIYNTFNGCSNLTNIDGLIDLGKAFLMSQSASYHNLTLSNSPLTRESCLKIFNTIYDLTTLSDYTRTPTIQLSSTTKSLLSNDDIAIATSKGWTVS